MRKIINQFERAERAWSILVDHAKSRRYTTYGELGARMSVHPRLCRYFLGIIQEYCRSNNLQPLQALVVNKHTGIPGEGYIATGTENIEDVHNRVYSYDWGSIPNPF